MTWTRDSTTVTEGTETVLDDPETAQYTHTLNVTTGGEYTCTVQNNKPSSDSATITLRGPLRNSYIILSTMKYSSGASPPSDVRAVQHGSSSIKVIWTPPSPLGDANGYTISYTERGGNSSSVDVDGGKTKTHILMGLTNGEDYTITIVATPLLDLPSRPVEVGTVSLCKL